MIFAYIVRVLNYRMKKLKLIALSLLLAFGAQTAVFAHCDWVDCGRIVNGLFYSPNYPNGMAAMSGDDGWIQQTPSGASYACTSSGSNTIKVGTTTYYKYTHKYICDMPLDDHITFLLLLPLAAIGAFFIYKRQVAIF